MNDQVTHLVTQSDEEMYKKFQELREKVVNLKESNRVIKSRLDALCGGVWDSEQSQCPECKRQKEDEAEVLKDLQEKVKTLEEEERQKENETKKLGKTLKIVIESFDKLLEIAQAKKISSWSGNKSRWDQGDNERNRDDEHKQGSCSGNQAECNSNHEMISFQDVKTSSESGQGQNNINPVNDSSGKSTENDHSSDGKNMDHADIRDKKCPNTDIGPEPDHSVHRSLQGEEHQAAQVQETQNQQIEKRNELVDQSTNQQTEERNELVDQSTNLQTEERNELVDQSTNQQTEKRNELVDQSTIQQTEKRNELVDQSTNLQNVGSLTEGVAHSQHSRSSGERSVSSVHASQGADSVTASVSEIFEIQTPGLQQTVNQLTKVSSSDKNSDRELKVEIAGDPFQEAVLPLKDVKARDTGENICSENGSIKNPNFQRKTQISGSMESLQHQQFDERRKDGHTDTTPASTVDLDQHAPVFRVPTDRYWSALAQKELDKARKRDVGEIHTVLCVDTSASMRQGSAWEHTKQFFNQFISGLEEVRKEFDITQEYVAISVFGKEVKVIKRLTNDFSELRQAFGTLKVGGPSVMHGGLLMALAGVGDNTHTFAATGIRILHRIILISDGRPTHPLLASGPDVYNAEEKQQNQLAVLNAVQNISIRKIRILCIPVGDADVTFLQTIADISYGKVFSIGDGRKLARKAANTVQAGLLINHWKMMKTLHSRMLSGSHSAELTLESVMLELGCDTDMQFLHPVSRIASLSNEDRAEVLEIAKDAIAEDLFVERGDAMEKYHYEFDDPDVKLPPLGSRVRRGPDWDKDLQDEDGPGTISGHHRDKRHVHVEWDRNGNLDVYRYGDMGKYDVVIVDEPRLLNFDDLILTGCHVKRGKDWKYGNQGGSPDAIGVVLKVLDDGKVVVRWPDKSKNLCRFGYEGFFDLEVCNPFDGQTRGGMKPASQSTPTSLGSQSMNQSASAPSKNKNVTTKILPKKNKNA